MKEVLFPRGQQGFTLVEIFLAILIFVLGFLPLLRLEVASIEGNSYAHNLTQATALAESKMEELLSMTYENLSNATPESKTKNGYIIKWSRTQDIPNTFTITVTVSWTDKEGSHNINISSIKGN